MPSNALLKIYCALILPYLNYGLLIWGWKSDRLLKLQKRAVRIISKSTYIAHTNLLFKNLNLLKIKDLCALHDYTFCYKMQNNMLPDYFLVDLKNSLFRTHEYSTRHANSYLLPAVRHEFARHSISYKYPFTINSMPENYKEKLCTHSLHGFKFYMRRLAVGSYGEECSILNCYVCTGQSS